MSEQYLGEIRVFPFGFAPRGWAPCNGTVLSIMQNQALFSILGTTYGGDGRTTFALPDLRGRVAISSGMGNGSYSLGQVGGEENHTLIQTEMPAHNHVPQGSTGTPDSKTPSGNYWGSPSNSLYGTAPDASMSPTAIANSGGSQAHNNMQPFLTLNFCIATQGIYPSRN